MAINNCYHRLILKIPAEFSAYRVLAKVRANPRNEIIAETDKCIPQPLQNIQYAF